MGSKATEERRARRKKQKVAIFEKQDGLCYYCKCKMELSSQSRKISKNVATIEHLQDRFTIDRLKQTEINKVIACYECNCKRGAERAKTAKISPEEFFARIEMILERYERKKKAAALVKDYEKVRIIHSRIAGMKSVMLELKRISIHENP